MIERRQDWQTILGDMIAVAAYGSFAWGTHDCATWAADVVRAISVADIDLAADFRGRYHDGAEGLVLVRRLCGGGLERLMERFALHHGLDEITPALAWRGDVALTDTEHGPALGIMWSEAACFVAPEGLGFVPRRGVRRCWRIG